MYMLYLLTIFITMTKNELKQLIKENATELNADFPIQILEDVFKIKFIVFEMFKRDDSNIRTGDIVRYNDNKFKAKNNLKLFLDIMVNGGVLNLTKRREGDKMTNMDSRIGILCRNGKTVYYTIIDNMYYECYNLAVIEYKIAELSMLGEVTK